MQCPECRINLKRRRIERDANKVKRENVCPECDKHYFSVELFRDDYDKTIKELENQIIIFMNEKDKIETRYNELTDALKIISDAVK